MDDAAPVALRTLDDLTFAVLDVETTGFDRRADRVIEAGVVRADAANNVLDEYETLINPGRPVSGGWVHGIDDAMVARAPSFGSIAPALGALLSGAVLVAHNAPFDRGFLIAELARLRLRYEPPYLCTMSLPGMLGLSAPPRPGLEWCCAQHGVALGAHHHALDDARACALLLSHHLAAARSRGAVTLADIKRLSRKAAKSASARSWALPVPELALDGRPSAPACPRSLR